MPVLDFSGRPAHPVTAVVDGDTITVQDGPKAVTVRLIGVDTPETVHPDQPPEPYGKEASTFLANLLKGESVYLVEDPNGDKIDRYGRKLAYAYRAPDGLFVNAEIVRQGYGEAYLRFPFSYGTQFKALEDFARSAEKGLWAAQAAANVPSVAPIPPPAAMSDDPIVYVTRTGDCYHREGCGSLSRSKIPMRLAHFPNVGVRFRQKYRRERLCVEISHEH
jgi:micrococcal nuclease